MQDIQKEQEAASGSPEGSQPPSVSPSRLTPLVVEVEGRSDWRHVELDVIGFRLSYASGAQLLQNAARLTVWPLTTSKGSFIRQG